MLNILIEIKLKLQEFQKLEQRLRLVFGLFCRLFLWFGEVGNQFSDVRGWNRDEYVYSVVFFRRIMEMFIFKNRLVFVWETFLVMKVYLSFKYFCWEILDGVGGEFVFLDGIFCYEVRKRVLSFACLNVVCCFFGLFS